MSKLALYGLGKVTSRSPGVGTTRAQVQKYDSYKSTVINGGTERHRHWDAEELTFGGDMERCLSEGRAPAMGGGAFPCSYMSLESSLGGCGPLLSPDLRCLPACLPVWTVQEALGCRCHCRHRLINSM